MRGQTSIWECCCGVGGFSAVDHRQFVRRDTNCLWSTAENPDMPAENPDMPAENPDHRQFVRRDMPVTI